MWIICAYFPFSNEPLVESSFFSGDSPISPNNVKNTFAFVPAPFLFPVKIDTLYLLAENGFNNVYCM